MKVVYEDNHLIVVSKLPGEIVQGDKTGDKPLSEEVASYLVEKYNKPGKAFVGVVHRLDRPVGGLVLFAKTSKALTRMNRLFSQGKVHKEYLAITCSMPTPEENELVSSLLRIPKFNKSFVVPPGTEGAKEARLRYRVLGHSEIHLTPATSSNGASPPDSGSARFSRLPYQRRPQVWSTALQS